MFGKELLKYGKNKMLFVLASALILGNLFTIYMYTRNQYVYFYIYECKEQYQEFVSGNIEVDMDGFYQREMDKQLEYKESYPVFLEEMEERAKNLKTISVFSSENSYVYRNLEKTCRDFAGLYDSSAQIDNCFGVRELIAYDIGIVFLVLFMLMISWFVFYDERNQGIMLLIKGTRRGHAPLAVGKLGVMLLFSLGYTLLQECSTVLLFGYLYGYGDISRSVQSVSEFRNCPYQLSVGQMIILYIVFRILIGQIIAAFMYGISICLRNEFTAFATVMVVAGMEVVSAKVFSITGFCNGWKCINLFYCWNIENVLGEYQNLNLFGYAVNKNECALVVGGLLMAVCCIGGIWSFCNFYQIRSTSRFEKVQIWMRKKTAFLWRHTNLLGFESFKVMIQQKKVWVVLVLVIICCNEICGLQQENSYAGFYEAMYHAYMKELAGKVTDERISYIQMEEETIADLYKELDEIGTKNTGDTNFLKRKIVAEIKRKTEGLGMVKWQLEALQAKEGSLYDKYFIDETAYFDCINDADKETYFLVWGMLGMIIWMAGIYPSDEKKNMMPILCATKQGRRTLTVYKNICACFGGLTAFLLTEIPLILRYYMIDGWVGLNQKLSDLTQVSIVSNMTLGIWLVIVFFVKLALFAGMQAVGLWLSKVTRNELVTITILGGVVVVIGILGTYFNMSISTILMQLYLK